MAQHEKIPPQNLEAEAGILGSVLFDKDIIPTVMSSVKPFYFYSERHRRVFEGIIRLNDNNYPIDLITLSEELRKSNSLDAIGGQQTLMDLVAGVETSAHVEEYIRIIREKAMLRNLISSAGQLVTDAARADVDVNEVLDRAERAVYEISQEQLESNTVNFRDTIKQCFDAIENAYQNQGLITGIPTGFKAFDEMTTGLHGSELMIVAGRPSMGKSAFATGIAEHVAVESQKPVAIFSLEMTAQNITNRMLCSHARVDAHNVRKGYLSQPDWAKLIAAAGKLSDAPIIIDDTPGISVFELRAKARRLKMQHDIQLLIVDYLQLMQSGSKVESRQQEISEISRKLKALARELNIPVIVLSQLNRAVESRTGNKPQLSDLRESGSIEQDADLVVLLYRAEYYNRTEENAGKATAIIAKQRNGPVGDCELAFISQFARFDNLSKREYPVEA